MASRCPMMRLKRVDLPTFGRPTMATRESDMHNRKEWEELYQGKKKSREFQGSGDAAGRGKLHNADRSETGPCGKCVNRCERF